jgi:hypothetical protein
MRTRLLIVIGLSVGAAQLLGMYVMLELDTVPIDRVVTNLERMISDDPKSVEIRVNLARLHSMAYARKALEIGTLRTGLRNTPGWGPGQPFFGHGNPHIQPSVVSASDPAAAAVAQSHLTKAIEAYRAVLVIAPRHFVAQIGLGWTLMESGNRTEAIKELRRAMELGWEGDSASRYFGEGRSATQEVAMYLTQLLDRVKDAEEIAVISKRLDEISKRPRAITPIAVPLRGDLSADAMIDTNRLVPFDLDGSGFPMKWTWLSRDAAWLVHDHRGTGQITSALQLFGSVTFWAFWQNGYHALKAMDDDGDGEIRGRERLGLSLWHDRNSNGISDRGEVRTLIDWGIVSLSTSYEYDASHQHEIAWSPSGVRFESGEVRPTYDLVMTTGRR